MGAVEAKIVQTEVLGTHEVFLLRPIDIPRLKIFIKVVSLGRSTLCVNIAWRFLQTCAAHALHFTVAL